MEDEKYLIVLGNEKGVYDKKDVDAHYDELMKAGAKIYRGKGTGTYTVRVGDQSDPSWTKEDIDYGFSNLQARYKNATYEPNYEWEEDEYSPAAAQAAEEPADPVYKASPGNYTDPNAPESDFPAGRPVQAPLEEAVPEGERLPDWQANIMSQEVAKMQRRAGATAAQFDNDEERLAKDRALAESLSGDIANLKEGKRESRRAGDREMKRAYKSVAAERQAQLDEVLSRIDQNPAYAQQLEQESKSVEEKQMALREMEGPLMERIAQEYGIDNIQIAPEYRNVAAAGRLYEDAQKTINAPLKFDQKQRGDGMRDFGKGFAEDMKNVDFWTLGATNIEDKAVIRNALLALQDVAGKVTQDEIASLDDLDLDETQKAVIDAYFTAQAANVLRSLDTSNMYQAGIGGAETLKFMAEMAMTAGLGKAASKGIAKAASKGAEKAVVKSVSDKLARYFGSKLAQMSPRTAAGAAGKWALRQGAKLTANQADALIRAGVMTLAQPVTYENIAERGAQVDEWGKVTPLGKAAAQGGADQFIETWTEMSGELPGQFLGAAFDGVARALGTTAKGKALVSAMRNSSARMLGGKARQLIRGSKGLVGIGWNNAGEYFEELLGAGIRDITGLEPGAADEFFQVQNLLDMTATFAPMAAIGLVTGTMNVGRSLHYANKLRQTEDALRAIVGDANHSDKGLDRFFDKYYRWMDSRVGGEDRRVGGTMNQQQAEELTAQDMATDFMALYQERAADMSPEEKGRVLEAMTDFIKTMQQAQVVQGAQEADTDADGQAAMENARAEMLRDFVYKGSNDYPGSEVVTGRIMVPDPSDPSGRIGSDTVFIVGDLTSTGEYPVVYPGGRTGFVNADDIGGIQTYAPGEYGRVLASEQKTAAEQERITAETEGQVSALMDSFQQRYPVGASANELLANVYQMNGETAPEWIAGGDVMVSDMNEQGVTFMNDKGASVNMSWEELAPALGGSVEVKTDADAANEAAGMLDAEDEARNMTAAQLDEAIKQGIVLEQTGEQVVGIIKDSINLQDGTCKATVRDRDGNERVIPFVYSEVLAKQQQAPAAAPEEIVPEAPAEAPAPAEEPAPAAPAEPQAPAYETPMKDGEVDWDKMLEENPAEFARQLDELNGGDSTMSKAAISARLKELKEKLAKTKPTKVNEIMKLKAQIKDLEDVQKSYLAQNQPRFQQAPEKKTEEVELAPGFDGLVQKFQGAPKKVGFAHTKTLPDGTKLKGHYVLLDANAVTASHDPANGWQPTEGFPLSGGQSANSRDYTKPANRTDTEMMAQRYDGRALESIPTVTPDGIVVDGNGRTMASQLAAKNGTDTAYNETLREEAQRFGFTEEDVAGFEHPRVVFVTDEALPYDVGTFDMFNAREQKRESKSEAANKIGRLLDLNKNANVVANIASYMDQFDTVAQFYEDPAAVKEVFNLLVGAGVFSEKDRQVYISGKDGKATDEGRAAMNNVFLGIALDKNAIEILVDVQGMGKITEKVVKALPSIIENSAFSDRFNLKEDLSKAIELYYHANQSYGDSKDPVKDYLNTPQIELGGAFPTEPEEVQYIARALQTHSPNKFKDDIAAYNKNVINAEQGVAALDFGEESEPVTKASALKNAIFTRNNEEYEPVRNQNEEVPANEGGGVEVGDMGPEGPGAVQAGNEGGAGAVVPGAAAGNQGQPAAAQPSGAAHEERPDTTGDTRQGAGEAGPAEGQPGDEYPTVEGIFAEAEGQEKPGVVTYNGIEYVTGGLTGDDMAELWANKDATKEADKGKPGRVNITQAIFDANPKINTFENEGQQLIAIENVYRLAQEYPNLAISKEILGRVKETPENEQKPAQKTPEKPSESPKESVPSQKEGPAPEPAEPEAPKQLTEEQIRNSGYPDENVIEAAVDYINGDTSFQAQLGYLTIEDYVRSNSQTTQGSGQGANETQLPGEGTPAGSAQAGRGGGQTVPVVPEPVGGPRREDRPQQDAPVLPGERGADVVPESESGRSTQPAGNRNGGGRSVSGANGPQRNPVGGEPASGNLFDGEDQGRGNQAAPRNTDAGSLDEAALGAELTDLLGQLEESSPLVSTDRLSTVEGILEAVSYMETAPKTQPTAKDAPLSSKRTKRIPAPLSLNGMEPKRALLLGKIMFTSAKAGYAHAANSTETSYRDFSRWFKAQFGKVVTEKLGEESLEPLILAAWDTKLKIHDTRLTLAEYVENMHNLELRLSSDIKENLRKQASVNEDKTTIKLGDRKDIKESLPALNPGQWDDVALVERQFFGEEHNDYDHAFGKGTLVTNGTGTGKTFTGMGVIKRFLRQGKNRILLVTPANMVDDWDKTAKLFGVKINKLENTKDKGEGVIITSYENFRANRELYKDTFDLVVYDEAQKIIYGQAGDETLAYIAHRRITNKNVDEATDRLVYKTPLGTYKLALEQEKEKLDREAKKKTITTERSQQIVLRQRAIDTELEEVNRKVELLKPSLRGQAEEAVKKTKVLMLSASPFNTLENLKFAEGYIFNYPKVYRANGTENTSDKARKAQFDAEWFGGDNHEQDEIDFADHLIDELETVQFRELENGYDHSRDFPDVSGMVMAERFNQAWEAINNDGNFLPLRKHAGFLTDYAWSSQLFEVMKVSALRDRIQEHLDAGRKIVLFHNRLHETKITSDEDGSIKKPPVGPPFKTLLSQAMFDKDATMASILFQQQFKDVLEWEDKLDYRPVPDQMIDLFATKNDRAKYQQEMEAWRKAHDKWEKENRPKLEANPDAKVPAEPKEPKLQAESICLFNGELTEKQKNESKALFNDDNSKKKIIIVTTASGGAGLSLHDTTGKHQRVMIQTSLPNSPIGFIQAEGRIFRFGNKSNAVFEYPRLGLNLEAYVFAMNFNKKVGTTENLAHGTRGRGFKDSIMTGFFENSGIVPIAGQGIGGVELDKRGSTLKDMAKALHDYEVSQRKGITQEDTAVPEPVGYKMAQWAKTEAGENALVPYAGRGSVPRYIPAGVDILALESNTALQTRMAITAGREELNIKETGFDVLHSGANKADVVFIQGATNDPAITPVGAFAKGFQHLNEGGRIIAVLPDTEETDAAVANLGPAAARRLSIKVAPGLLGEEPKRIVMVDKITDPKLRAKATKTDIDLSGVTDQTKFFQQIDLIEAPDRIVDKDAIAARKMKALIPQFKSSSFIDDMSVSLHYKTGAPEGINIHYKTKKGFKYAKKKLEDFTITGSYRGNYEYIRMSEFRNPNQFSDLVKAYTAIKDILLEDDAELRRYCRFDADVNAETVADYRKLLNMYLKLIRAGYGYNDSQMMRVAAGMQADVSAADITSISSLTELREKFQAAVKDDEEYLKMFDDVLPVSEKAGVKVTSYQESGNFLGEYNNKKNELRLNTETWNKIPDEKRAQTALHELIHSVTVYAIQGAKNGVAGMSDALYNAANSVVTVFEQLQKGDPRHVRMLMGYALQNEKELMAEMANPDVRAKLKERPMWTRETPRGTIVSGAEQEGFEQTTAWDLLNLALHDILNNFDQTLFDRFRNRQSDVFFSMDRQGRTLESDGGIRYSFGEDAEEPVVSAERTEIENAATDLGASLHTKVVFEDSAPAHARNIRGSMVEPMGWYDTTDNSIHLNMGRVKSTEQAESVVLHETVGHYGLRTLFGKDFDNFLDNVYNNATQGIKDSIDAIAKDRGLNRRTATEEYLAMLAEEGFSDIQERSFWQNVKDWFMDMLGAAGVRLSNELTDADLRYILWESKRNLEQGDVLRSAEKAITRAQLREEAELSRAPQPAEDRVAGIQQEIDGVDRFDPRYNELQEQKAEAIRQRYEQIGFEDYDIDVTTRDGFVDYARAKGVSEEEISSHVLAIGIGAAGITFSNGEKAAISDNIMTTEEADRVYYHERVHEKVREEGPEFLQEAIRAFGVLGGDPKLTRDLLVETVRRLSNGTNYDNFSNESLADEIIAHVLEKAYLGRDISEVCRAAGITSRGEKFLKDYYEQRKATDPHRPAHILPGRGGTGGVQQGPQGTSGVQGERSTAAASARDREGRRDAEYLAAVKRGDLATAQRIVNEVAQEHLDEFNALQSDEGTVTYKYHRGPMPKKWRTVYKAFNVDELGGLHSTYAGVVDAIPFGVALDAQPMDYVVSPKNGRRYIPGTTGNTPASLGLPKPPAPYTSYLSYRPAFHASSVPWPGQMRVKGPDADAKKNEYRYLPHNKLIFKVEVAADVDYESQAEAFTEQLRAEAKARGDNGTIRKQLWEVPVGGHYTYNNGGEEWVLAGTFRIVGVLSEDEIRRLNDAAGKPNTGSTQLLWINGYHPEEFGLTDDAVTAAVDEGMKSKLLDAVTYDDNGNPIPPSQRFNPQVNDIRYSFGDSKKYLGNSPSRASRALRNIHTANEQWNIARHLYNTMVNTPESLMKEQYQNMYESVHVLMNAIETESGRKAKDFEDFRLLSSAVPSKNKRDHEVFGEKYLDPMNKAIADLTKTEGVDYDDVVKYAELKHGLERNIEMARRNAMADYEADYRKKSQKIRDDIEAAKKEMDKLIKNGSYADMTAKAQDRYDELSQYIKEKEGALQDLLDDFMSHRKALYPKEYYREMRDNAIRDIKANDALTHAEKGQLIDEENRKYEAILEDIANNPKKYETIRDNDVRFAHYRGTDGDKDNLGTDYAAIRSWFSEYQDANGNPLSETPIRLSGETKDEYNGRLCSMRHIMKGAEKLTGAEAMAQAWIDEFEKKVGKEGYENLWNTVNGATDWILKHQLDNHSISREQYDALSERFKYYVPLRGFSEDTAEDLWNYGQEDHSGDFAAPLLPMQGRQSKPAAPFAYIATMADTAIVTDNRNTLRRALYRFVANRPDNSLVTIADSWYVNTHQKDDDGHEIWEPSYPAYVPGMSQDEMRAARDAFEQNMRDMAAAGEAVLGSKGLNLRGAVAHIDSQNRDRHLVKVLMFGKEHFLIVNGNPRAALALNGQLNIESLNNNAVLRVFRDVTRIMSMANTGLSPSFWFANFAKDFITGSLNTAINEDAGYLAKFEKNYAVAVSVIPTILKGGKFVDNPNWTDRQRARMKKYADLYSMYLKNGGPTGFTTISNIEQYESLIRSAAKKNKSETVAKIQRLWNGLTQIGKIGEALEQVPRFAAFLTSMEEGRSIERSVRDAKDVTLDFNTKGAASGVSKQQVKQLQKVTKEGAIRNLTALERAYYLGILNLAPSARSLIMFFNPAVQGVDKMIRNFKNSPGKAAAVTGALVFAGFARAVFASLFPPDDEDNYSYNDLNEYRKRTNFVIPVGPIDILWPISQEFAPFYALGDIIAGLVLHRNGPSDKPVLEALETAGSILPLNPFSPMDFVPDLLTPIIEVMRNRNFMGSYIYYDYASNKDLPGYTKAPESTWGWLVDASQMLNDITGGDYARKGWLDINPAVVQHLLEGVGGGILRDLGNLTQEVENVTRGDDFKLRNTMILRRFALDPREYRNAYVYNQYTQYYNAAMEAKRLHNKYKDDVVRQIELEDSKEWEYYQIYRNYESEIKSLREERDAAEDSRERADVTFQLDSVMGEFVSECSEVFHDKSKLLERKK